MNTRLLLMSAICVALGVAVRYDTEDYRRFLALCRDAWTLAGISFKERGWAMQLDKGQQSRIERGELPLHAHRLAMLGAQFPRFFQALAVVIVRDYGLSPESQAAATLAGMRRAL